MNKITTLRTQNSILFYSGVFIITFIICALILTLTKPSWCMKLNHKNKLIYSWGVIISFCTGIASLFVVLSLFMVKKTPSEKKEKETYDPN